MLCLDISCWPTGLNLHCVFNFLSILSICTVVAGETVVRKVFVYSHRLLVQLEETERTFDDFWFSHSARLRQCLELRRFEQDFKELQVWV